MKNLLKDTSEFVSPRFVSGDIWWNEVSKTRENFISEIDFLIAVWKAREELRQTSYRRALEKSINKG